ncbi:hypothetical protein OG232_14835 [Streptomyces sp. NBC_01411]|uniref:hypothetical protein n=1 Tax=Streptomyces sp. NBC_01411 TaxID=2903857 RepID=UPI00324AA528
MSRLLWIAVPGGAVTDGQATLRILIVPQLTEGTLKDNGLADWPAVLGHAELSVEVRQPDGSGSEVPYTLVSSGSSDVWQQFFSAVDVRGWQQPPAYDPPTVEPSTVQHDNIRKTYATSAKAVATPDVVHDQLASWHAGSPDGVASNGAPSPPPRTGRSDVDFHRAVAMLREHPAVLRELGLIVELTLGTGDKGLPPATPTAPGAVRVRWPASTIAPEVVSPWTAYELDSGLFLPASTATISSGLVDLDVKDPAGNPRWQVATVDIDGAVSRLRDAARTYATDRTDGQTPPANDATLPALRSAGLLLMRRDRAEHFAARSDAARANAARDDLSDGPPLTADDLVLGYRMDVRLHGAGDSLSLCRRNATYFLNKNPIGPQQLEEGHVKANAAIRDERTGELRADEVVSRWSGWSLAVPRPALGAPLPPAPNPAPALPFDFSWQFEPVPGSLPELRFNTSYSVRLRVADIAGGGLEHDDPAADRCFSDLTPYARHEPLPAPQIPPPDGLVVTGADGKPVVHPDALGPGGSIDQLVIRSDLGATSYVDNAERTLLPPRTTVDLAEQHGRLDGSDEETTGLVQRAVQADGPGLPEPLAAGVAVYFVREQPTGQDDQMTDTRDWSGIWPDFAAKSLRLVPGAAGSDPELRWANDDGLLALAPGRQVTVELASYLKLQDLDNFVIKNWLSDSSVPDPPGDHDSPESAVLNGRHPMVTPPHVVTLVHAVRHPLQAPDGDLVPVRNEGDPFAVLAHDQAPLLSLDAGSTAQLDIVASWQEVNDSTAPQQLSQGLPSLAIGRRDSELATIRHEFGDTRHRRVSYTMTAVTRFRQFFAAEEPDDAFVRTQTLGPVSVPSSARPVPPRVLSVRPAFLWEGEVPDQWDVVERTRLGDRLRVELARPWFTTGEGERLALVVCPDAAGAGDPVLTVPELLTCTARDPLWSTPGPSGIVRTSSCVTQAAGARSVHPAGRPDLDVDVVGFPVAEEGGHWFSDVVLPGVAAASYSPFVQLALARYQEESLAGLELSTVVRTSLVQLLPDRTLRLERGPDGVLVTLSGLAPQGPAANRVIATLEAYTEHPGAGADSVQLTSLAADPGTAGLPAWTRVPGCQVEGTLNETLTPLPPAPAGPQTGTPSRAPGAGRLRVVVREVESIPADRTDIDVSVELTERTVFVDAIPLPVNV